MSDWLDKQENNFNRKPVGTLISLGVKFFFVAIVVGIGASWLGLCASVATAPVGVIKKTITPDNIIYNYEWFYDVNAQYEARTGQLIAWTKEYVAEEDADEKRRLRIEVQAVAQSCRNLVTSYNANSEKMNREIFKGWSLPESLNISACEGKS